MNLKRIFLLYIMEMSFKCNIPVEEIFINHDRLMQADEFYLIRLFRD